MSKKHNSATTQKKRSLRVALSLAAGIALLSIPIWVNSITGSTEPQPTTPKPTKSLLKADLSRWEKELCCEHSAQIATSPVRTGDQSIKITLKKGDPYFRDGRPRAELRSRPVSISSENWYGLSVFIPKEYKLEPRTFEIITQFASPPDKHLGEEWHRPSLTLSMRESGFTLTNYGDEKQVTPKGKDKRLQQWNLGSVEQGRWIDFVYHAKWSYKSDGFLRVWKDGKLVAQRKGSNTFNDKVGPFFKLGIYKPEWKFRPERSITTERTIYFDEVRFGNASASYKDVAP